MPVDQCTCQCIHSPRLRGVVWALMGLEPIQHSSHICLSHRRTEYAAPPTVESAERLSERSARRRRSSRRGGEMSCQGAAILVDTMHQPLARWSRFASAPDEPTILEPHIEAACRRCFDEVLLFSTPLRFFAQCGASGGSLTASAWLRARCAKSVTHGRSTPSHRNDLESREPVAHQQPCGVADSPHKVRAVAPHQSGRRRCCLVDLARVDQPSR